MKEYETKDSGKRHEWPSGMVRDTEAGKERFDLLVAKELPYEDQFLTLWRDSQTGWYAEFREGDEQEEVARDAAEGFMIKWLSSDGTAEDAVEVATLVEQAEYYVWCADHFTELTEYEGPQWPYEEQLMTRWAALMARGAQKYGDRNWEKGNGPGERDRCKSSAYRHLKQWLARKSDEDHAAAVLFNLMAVHYYDTQMPKPYRVRDEVAYHPPATVPLEVGERLPANAYEAHQVMQRRLEAEGSPF